MVQSLANWHHTIFGQRTPDLEMRCWMRLGCVSEVVVAKDPVITVLIELILEN